MKKDNIPGLEGYYISRLGTLWSRYHKSGKLTHSEWHKVKPNHNQKGYLFVQKKGKCWYLHRLVALAWIPNPNNYPIVCHKDNVVTHNWYKNLYWGTQKDNMQIMLRWVVDYTNLLKDLKLGFTILLMVNLDTLNSLANLQIFSLDSYLNLISLL